VLIHILDGTTEDVCADFSQINSELALFDPALKKKPQVVAVNKMDLPAAAERIESIKKEFKKKGIQVFPISALARQDLFPVLWKAKQLLDDTDSEMETQNIPVYRPESKETTFKITKFKDRWVISGAAVERAAAMTFWENFESIRRFHRILDAMGIVEKLHERGIEEGDTVVINDHELVWTQEWKDD